VTYILALTFRYKTSERTLSFNEAVPLRTLARLLRSYCRRITGQANNEMQITLNLHRCPQRTCDVQHRQYH